MKDFEQAFRALNPAQKQAVETLDGPVMVVAGPGTGKTQVLTLRIAHILQSTDTPPSGVLCLTFTRSGVSAMRDRLEQYIGPTARDVQITTFHSFAINLVEKYYDLLDFVHMPKLLEDRDAILLIDELLQNGEWEYISPRTDKARYFYDLKSLVSLLKRERISPTDFQVEIDHEIDTIKNDPESISTRGPSKGQLKKEIEKKLDALLRTREIVTFYTAYEQLKRERSFMDYDDCLEYALTLVEQYEDVRADIYENYLYVLVDEHQDSNNVQNSFLKAVWAHKDTPIERPNIFVVGDDRQLIYGFAGANINYFTDFSMMFGKAACIVLTENYRSIEPILRVADELLKSSVATEKLSSNRVGADPITLREFAYTRDEIIGAGIYFKQLLASGVAPSQCTLLVPKNRQVKHATEVFRSLGLPVVSEQSVSLLELPGVESVLRVLELITNPCNGMLIADLVLDKASGIPPIIGHTFIKNTKKIEELTLDTLIQTGNKDGLFADDNPIGKFGQTLTQWVNTLAHEKVSHIVSVVGNELLIDQAHDHDELLQSIEIVRSFIHSAIAWEERYHMGTLSDFVAYFKRLRVYNNQVAIVRLGQKEGISINTFHKSKGLEYDHVWIAHVNEEIIMSEKHGAFTLPESIKMKIQERDVLTAKRELYVAITRAKQFCTLSFASHTDDGNDMTLTRIIAELTQDQFRFVSAEENEQAIITDTPKNYARMRAQENKEALSPALVEFVKGRFSETKISVSMLNNFFECPWKWYFRNFLRLPETKSVSLALGSAVHSTIEYILKEPVVPQQTLIMDRIMYELNREGVTDPADIKTLSTDAFQAVAHFTDTYYPHLAQNRTSERSITVRDPRFPNLTMYGKIDLTEKYPDGTSVVTDFKTGKSKTTGVIEKTDEEGRLSSYMRQLAMYSYLIKETEGIDVTESRLLFLEEKSDAKNALYTTHIDRETIDHLVQDITDYETTLQTGAWMERPCYAKPFGNSSVCEYCSRIEKILGK